jgi:MoxR-like ATPase
MERYAVLTTMEQSGLLEKLQRFRANVESVFIGKPEVVNQLLIGLLGRGHVLVEDVPGVGKTVLARALAKSIDCRFSRVQLTPDLLPSDIIGISIYNDKTGMFEFKKGPVFANIVLADEINRTTPRTQSALLEAMNESQVSVDGTPIPLEQPFMVIATQNPFEFEGTYLLPENQLDRFILRIRIGYPTRENERLILRKQPDREPLDALEPVMESQDLLALQELAERVRVDDAILDYLQDVVDATRRHDSFEVGVSPRGALAILRAVRASSLLAGREYAIPDDVKDLVIPVFAHRVVNKSYLRDSQAASNDQILGEILEEIPVPA